MNASLRAARVNTPTLDPLRSFIGGHGDYDLPPDDVSDEKLSTWLAEVGEHRRNCARSAYLVGRALRAHRPGHGEVTDWMKERASTLGKSERTLRLYLMVAEAIDAESATPLPISVLDRPLRDVPAAIRSIREGRSPDTRPKKTTQRTSKVQAWRHQAKTLLRMIPRGSRKALLEAHLLAVYHQLLKLDPSLAPFDAAADVTEFALAAAAALQVGKPLPSDVLAARKKVPPVFGYPGGKFRVVDLIIEAAGLLQADGLWGDHVFREPFVGGGAVMLNMLATGRAKRVWINDANRGVAALWNAIIREPEALCTRIGGADPTREMVHDLWAKQDAGVLTGLDLAVAELVSRQCGYRNAGRMSGVAPKDVQHDWRPASTAQKIMTAHHLLRGRVEHGECTCLDAVDVIRQPGPCFVFGDPPYFHDGKRLYPQNVTADYHVRLADALHATDQPWLLTYDDHPVIRGLYDEDVIVPFAAPRPSGHRRKAKPVSTESELMVCSGKHPSILRPDQDPDLIGELFGLECEP